MATELQYLYRMRQILEYEQYAAEFNKELDKNINQVTERACLEESNNIRIADQKYLNTVNNTKEYIYDKKLSVFVIVCLLVIAIPICASVLVSPNLAKSLTYIFVTLLWGFGFLCYFAANAGKDGTAIAFGVIAGFVAIFTIVAASNMGVHGFWRWLLAVLVASWWPVTNFFFMKPVIWISIVTAAGVFFLLIYFQTMLENDKEAEEYEEVIEAKHNCVIAQKTHEYAYNVRYPLIKAELQKRKKNVNAYANEKRAMQGVVPTSMQNLNEIYKIIWCIEQRYANNIVEARNWFLTQEFREKVLQRMDIMIGEIISQRNVLAHLNTEIQNLRVTVAEEVRKNTQAVIASGLSIEKTIKDQTNKINATAQNIADSNERISTTVDRMWRD